MCNAKRLIHYTIIKMQTLEVFIKCVQNQLDATARLLKNYVSIV